MAQQRTDQNRMSATPAPVAGQVGTHTAPSRTSDIAERIRTSSISIETLIWTVLLAVTAWTRFWDLGYREFHHDEALHVFYSWEFANGTTPYVHNPLSHGPFLFHANALVYLLFGESNYTSRMLPALVGVLIVATPWLLRGRAFLGRWGALAAGFMLFISPSFLYYTRFIRHDPYTALGSLLLCVAIFRYLEHPQRRWMMTAFVCVGLMLTNHEIVFAILLAFVAVLWVALLVTKLRALIPVQIAAVAFGVAILALHSILNWKPLPNIPWEYATDADTRAFYAAVFENPLILSILVLGVVFVVACVVVGLYVAEGRRLDDQELTSDAVFGDALPNSIGYGVLAAWRDRFGLAIGVLVMLTIWLVLFTTFFTNPNGVATATYSPRGTLLYWLGQQGERRGEQPWFYFITEGLQYEWLAIVLGTVGLVLTGVRLWWVFRGQTSTRSVLFMAFLSCWTVFLFAVLSWAGEKMPWLIMHIVLPAVLLGAVVVDEVVEGAIAWWRGRRDCPQRVWAPAGYAAMTVALVVLAFAAFFILAHLTSGIWVEEGRGFWTRIVPQSAIDDWWMIVVPPVAALAIICIGVIAGGMRRTAHATLVAAFLVMSLFQAHAGFRVTFLDGDGAKDTLIYNTVGSDVMTFRNDMHELSMLTYGDLSMPIVYDDCASNPLNVDLNDMPNAVRGSTIDVNDQDRPPVMIGVTAKVEDKCSAPNQIDGYTVQTIMFRWHEPEADIYRNFAIAPELPPTRSIWGRTSAPHDLPAIIQSVWNSTTTLAEQDGQARAFRLLMYREMGGGVLKYYAQVYIRDDYLPYYNQVRYGT